MNTHITDYKINASVYAKFAGKKIKRKKIKPGVKPKQKQHFDYTKVKLKKNKIKPSPKAKPTKQTYYSKIRNKLKKIPVNVVVSKKKVSRSQRLKTRPRKCIADGNKELVKKDCTTESVLIAVENEFEPSNIDGIDATVIESLPPSARTPDVVKGDQNSLIKPELEPELELESESAELSDIKLTFLMSTNKKNRSRKSSIQLSQSLCTSISLTDSLCPTMSISQPSSQSSFELEMGCSLCQSLSAPTSYRTAIVKTDTIDSPQSTSYPVITYSDHDTYYEVELPCLPADSPKAFSPCMTSIMSSSICSSMSSSSLTSSDGTLSSGDDESLSSCSGDHDEDVLRNAGEELKKMFYQSN